jgi:thymidylate synthase (FAD)
MLRLDEKHDDFAKQIACDRVERLLDGKGHVTLVDFEPRIVPQGYTPEYMIVRAARTSYDCGLKDPDADAKLLDFLAENEHTSPTEMCGVTLCLYLPLPMCVHFMRHRTGKFNSFSQRYSETRQESRYSPLAWNRGIRFQSSANKQSSQLANSEEVRRTAVVPLFEQAEALLDRLDGVYHQMVEQGVAKEIARFYLPQAQYTTLFMKFDLNNLLKLLRLRNHERAQEETAVYAAAIEQLCEPLFPRLFAAYRNAKQGLTLTKPELDSWVWDEPLVTRSVSKRAAFEQKRKRLEKQKRPKTEQ